MTHKNEHIVTGLALTLVLLWMPATLLLAGIDRLSFRTLDVRDGLADNFVRDIVFTNNAALTTSEGTVLLGSYTGYVCIPSFSVQRQRPPSPVHFTDFRINSSVAEGSLDEELVSRVIADIESNIQDADYSVVQLSSNIGMTRGHLYKKLMAIVGKSPVEFIRIVRLKRGKSFH